MEESNYPRDMVGYGGNYPKRVWPNNAKLALNFVINYEEGGESCILHGDSQSEFLLSEMVGAGPIQNERHMNMESLYEYGSRCGYWKLSHLFSQFSIPVTVFAVGMALERNSAVCEDLRGKVEEEGWEVASHGYRWLDYQSIPPNEESQHISKTVHLHEELIGKRPVGLYQGKPNENTRSLMFEEGGFLYDSDVYNDDLPYWTYDHINNKLLKGG